MRVPKKLGFTLVELVVVISIIAILASLLVPAISKANEHARSARCMSNVRQISLALQLYVDDHKTYPRVDSPRPNEDYNTYVNTDVIDPLTWRNSLESYVGTQWTNRLSIFQCPTFTLLVAGQTPNRPYKWSRGAYGYNGIQTNSLCPSIWSEAEWNELPVSEGEVRVPSRMIALGDAWLFETDPGNDLDNDFNGLWTLNYFPLELQLAHQSARAQKATRQRHFSRFNIGFCDGHVEAIKNDRLFADEAEAQRIWYVDNEPHNPFAQ